MYRVQIGVCFYNIAKCHTTVGKEFFSDALKASPMNILDVSLAHTRYLFAHFPQQFFPQRYLYIKRLWC